MTTEALVVLCTVPDAATAEKLARGLIDARLAACVNIVSGIRSIYAYQGSLHTDDELQLIIKARATRYDELERWLLREHPYEVPEVLALPVTRGSTAYLEWLRGGTDP